MDASSCPTHRQWTLYALGELSEVDADQLTSHLEDCSVCERKLSAIEKQSLLPDLQRVVAPPRYAHEPQCGEFVGALLKEAHWRAGKDSRVEQESRVGQRIRDYELIDRLGQGAMGAVYKARHLRLNKIVAIKVLTERLGGSPAATARFKREMRAVGQLAHPNIVQALDAGDVDGVSFLAMEMIEGLDLARLTTQRRKLDVADACEIVRQTALGLQYAHDQGQVHRDIKPSNLMLCMAQAPQQPSGETKSNNVPVVKILDLGLAMIDEEDADGALTDDGQLMGTLEFMAPEQAQDTHAVDLRADIYSLGATLFRLLTGHVPFDSEQYRTPVKRLNALTNLAAPSIVEKRNDLPPEVINLVDRMLAREPDERPQSMSEVARLLEATAAAHRLDALLLHRHAEFPQPTVRAEESTSASVDSAPTLGVTDEKVAARPSMPLQPSTRSKRTVPLRALIPVLSLFGLLYVAIWITTEGGHVRIVAADPSIDVTVDVFRDGQPIKSLRIDSQAHRHWYRSGAYEVRLAHGTEADIRIVKNKFTLKRGHDHVVTISRAKTVKRKQPLPKAGDKQTTISSGVAVDTKPLKTLTLHVSIPRRELPDITQLPRGKVHVWGVASKSARERVPVGVGEFANFSDFVEVQVDSNIGWWGLRANGDVLNWRPHIPQSRSGIDVCVLNRTSCSNYGELLSSDGKIINRGSAYPELTAYDEMSGIVDMARSYPTGDWTILTSDGQLHFVGQTDFPPPEATDVVRVSNWYDQFIGIRENGELICWGRDPTRLPDLSNSRFAKMQSTAFHTILLTRDGKLITLDRSRILSLPSDFQQDGWVDIACGDRLFAARRADGHWRAWGEDKSQDAVAKINSLGPNVPSLSISRTILVWVEAEEESQPLSSSTSRNALDTQRTKAARAILERGIDVGQTVIPGELRIVVDGSRKAIKKPEEVPAGPFRVDHIVSGPDMLDQVTLLGAEVTHVTLRGRPLTLKDTERLAELPRLESLILYDPRDTSGKSAEARTNDNLTGLRGCSKLRVLHLHQHHAKELNLPPLPLLEEILINGPMESVRALGKQPKLELLNLFASSVTDEGLKFTTEPPHLKIIRIEKCNHISDKCLSHLPQVKSLQKLSLLGTRVTRAGVETFQKQLPQCEVSWGGTYAKRIVFPPLDN